MYHCIILYHALISYSFVEPVGRKWNRSASLSSSWGSRLGRTCFRVRLGTSLGVRLFSSWEVKMIWRSKCPAHKPALVSAATCTCAVQCALRYELNLERLLSNKITPKGLQKNTDVCHKLPGPGDTTQQLAGKLDFLRRLVRQWWH